MIIIVFLILVLDILLFLHKKRDRLERKEPLLFFGSCIFFLVSQLLKCSLCTTLRFVVETMYWKCLILYDRNHHVRCILSDLWLKTKITSPNRNTCTWLCLFRLTSERWWVIFEVGHVFSKKGISSVFFLQKQHCTSHTISIAVCKDDCVVEWLQQKHRDRQLQGMTVHVCLPSKKRWSLFSCSTCVV